MEKFDFKKAHKALYKAPTGNFAIIEVPPLNYLMIDGSGDPNTASEYKLAVEALYAASYTLKFMSKAALHRDYVVPPLEGLWWSEDLTDFAARRKGRWHWTMMIAVPDFVERSLATQAIAKATQKKESPALNLLRRIEREQHTRFGMVRRLPVRGPARRDATGSSTPLLIQRSSLERPTASAA